MVFDFCVNAIIDALIDTNNKLKRYKQQYRISAKNGELYIVTIYYVLWISSSLSLGTEESSTTSTIVKEKYFLDLGESVIRTLSPIFNCILSCQFNN